MTESIISILPSLATRNEKRTESLARDPLVVLPGVESGWDDSKIDQAEEQLSARMTMKVIELHCLTTSVAAVGEELAADAAFDSDGS